MQIHSKKIDFDVKLLSSIRTVGSINNICFPENATDVQLALLYAKENGLTPYVLGGGSNTLLGYLDKTFIISDKNFILHWEVLDDKLIVSSNTTINHLVLKAAEEGLYGLDFLYGIPAHLGGLVTMNAGAYGKNISDYLEWIDIVDENGERRVYKDDIDFSYRKINISGCTNSCTNGGTPFVHYITYICLKLSKSPQDITVFLKDREAKHPLDQPSLGCFFKNPENQHAGYLIEQTGLKNHQIGGAKVSSKHGNFLINAGDAQFEDFIKLIQYVQEKVQEKFNINLELEIRIINEKE